MDTVRAYYWLAKPGIVYGNALSAIAGFFLAAHGHIAFWRFAAMLIGICFVMASACVCNNYLDRGIDILMLRTKKRASATGRISLRSGILYAATLGFLGFGSLLLFVNLLSAVVACIGFLAYVGLYGYFKRTTVHGTLVGSLSGAIPPVVGYVAVTNSLDTTALLLFLALAAWQMPHFYAIAIYRKKEYAAASIPVMPVRNGVSSTQTQILLYVLLFLAICSLFTLLGHAGWTFLLGMLGLGVVWLKLSLEGFGAPDKGVWARHLFKFSLIVLLAFCTLISLDWLLP